MEIDYYKILQVHPECDLEILKSNYELLKKRHKNNAEYLELIEKAYEILKDTDLRNNYNKTLNSVSLPEKILGGSKPRYNYIKKNDPSKPDVIKGKYLEGRLLSVIKNKVFICNPDCICLDFPKSCKSRFSLSVRKEKLVYTEVILELRNIFEYELYISLESNGYLIDQEDNLYKADFLSCEYELSPNRRLFSSGTWLRPNTKAKFHMAFPEVLEAVKISSITFEQNLFSPGFQFGWVRDTEIYTLELKE